MPEILNTGTAIQFLEPIGTARIMTADELVELFEARREQLLALIHSKLSSRLRRRFDPEAVLQDAMVRARTRTEWLSHSPTPADLDRKLRRLVCEQTNDLLRGHL